MTHVDVVPQESGSAQRIAARVTLPAGIEANLFIEGNVDLVRHATPWVPALLPIAMWAGADVSVAGAVDPAVVASSRHAQALLHRWYPSLSVVDVHPAQALPEEPPAAGVGCFFSGGVDSFFSVLRHREEVTHLIFAHGFDIPIGNEDLAGRARAAAREAAESLGRPLIEIRTNLRELSNGRSDWQTQYHGAAMAAVGHAISGHVSRILVPGSYSEKDLHPWGTHPDLDPHWSGSRVGFEHDSVDVTRAEKVRGLADHQVALDHLRVCYKNKGGAYNCGRCEKCLRTMINLSTVDALQRSRTLPRTLDLKAVRRMRVSSEAAHFFINENIAMLESLPTGTRDEELLRALKVARTIGYVRRPVRAAGRPVMRRVVRPLRRRLRS